MPNALLIAKLKANGVSDVQLLENRYHRFKIMGRFSDWVIINRGIPKWSVPFISDSFHIDIKSKIAEYIDDDHLYCEKKCWYVLKKMCW